MKVFKNMVLRTIFWPSGEVTTNWRKLHNEQLHELLNGYICVIFSVNILV
jgi:hypothetical protein